MCVSVQVANVYDVCCIVLPEEEIYNNVTFIFMFDVTLSRLLPVAHTTVISASYFIYLLVVAHGCCACCSVMYSDAFLCPTVANCLSLRGDLL